MFERFSDDARRTVVRALVEARLLGHSHVGTEHALIALAAGNGTASAALAAQGVNLDRARSAVAETVERERPPSPWDNGPYTARAKHIFELGMHEAFGLGHEYVTNGHLLLGILGLGQGNAVRTLEYLGVDFPGLRERLEEGLLTATPPTPPLARGPLISTGRFGIRDATPTAMATEIATATVAEPADPVVPANPTDPGPTDGQAAGAGRTCSFCTGELPPEGRFVAGASAAICAGCIRACAQLLGYKLEDRVSSLNRGGGR